MEPRPLLEDDATEIEKVLLRAGRTDGPRREAGAHVLAVLAGLAPASDLPATLRPGHGGESGLAAASARPAAFVRWAKIALVAVGLGGAAIVTHSSNSGSRRGCPRGGAGAREPTKGSQARPGPFPGRGNPGARPGQGSPGRASAFRCPAPARRVPPQVPERSLAARSQGPAPGGPGPGRQAGRRGFAGQTALGRRGLPAVCAANSLTATGGEGVTGRDPGSGLDACRRHPAIKFRDAGH